MIRINLLPVPKVRKQEALFIQAGIGLIILGFFAGACYFLGASKQAEIAKINSDIQARQKEIDELKAKVGEVEKYKKQLQTLEQQIGVIRSLEAGRTGPVKMLDEFTELVPRKLWIHSFKENNKMVTMDGFADSGPVIADFLESLKVAKYFSNPQLSSVQLVEQDGNKIHKFTISVQVKYDI